MPVMGCRMSLRSVKLIVFLILLHSVDASGQSEKASGGFSETSLLVLVSLFSSLDNLRPDKGSGTLPQNEADFELSDELSECECDSCFVISCPLQNTNPSQASSTESLAASSPGKTHCPPVTALPASCFLTPVGQGDDDPDQPPENNDQEFLELGICPICQESLPTHTMELTYCCGRLFHADCLTKYLRHSANGLSCPLCRTIPWCYYDRSKPNTVAQPGRRPLRCPHCRSTFRHQLTLSDHLRLRHDYCWHCPVSLGNEFHIQQHNVAHGFTFMCAFCNWPATEVDELQAHMDIGHPYRSPRQDCFCFGSVTPYQQMLEQGVRHYQCSVCSSLTHSYQEHRVHMQEHRLFLCLCCESRFGTASALEQHARHCSLPDSEN